MESLPSELVIEMLRQLTRPELSRMAQVCRRFHHLISSVDLWATKAYYELSFPKKLFHALVATATPRQIYVTLGDWVGSPNRGFALACDTGNLEVIKYFLAYRVNVNLGLARAAAHGHLEVVRFLLASQSWRRRQLKWPLVEAIRHGHHHISSYLLTQHIPPLNRALMEAARQQDFEMVQYLRSLGATNINVALNRAALVGDFSSVKYLIEAGANNLNQAMDMACRGGHLHLVRYFVELGVLTVSMIVVAATYGHLKIIKYFKEILTGSIYPNGRRAIWLKAQRAAEAHGHVEVYEYLDQT
jgi:hypothetical protein